MILTIKTNQHKLEKSRKKVLLQNIGLVFASLFLFLFVLEIIIRFFGYGNLVIYQPDPKLFWKPLPNQSCYTKFGHKPVHINSKGTRGKDFDEAKPNNAYRIICLGDSKTFGWGLSEGETYSGLLNKMLQEYIGNSLKIEVINAGVNAWSYEQIYVYLRDIGMRYSPDMVILADANLWTQFSEDSNKEFIDKMLIRIWLKNMLRRSAIYHFFLEVKLKKYYEKYRTKFIPVDPTRDELFKSQQKKDSKSFYKSKIRNIFELLETNKVAGLLIYVPTKDLLLNFPKPIILQVKEQVSKEYDIPLIDFTKDFANNPIQLFLPNDPAHPNYEGNKIITKRIYDILVTQLEN